MSLFLTDLKNISDLNQSETRNTIQNSYDHHLRYEPCAGFIGNCIACRYYKERLSFVDTIGRMDLYLCQPILTK